MVGDIYKTSLHDGQSHQRQGKMKTDRENPMSSYNGSQQAPKGKPEREKATEIPTVAALAKGQQGATLGEGSHTIKGDKQNIWTRTLKSACGPNKRL